MKNKIISENNFSKLSSLFIIKRFILNKKPHKWGFVIIIIF